MRYSHRRILNGWTLLSAFLLLCGCGSGPAMVDRNGVTLNLVLPANFDPSRTYPWVIFNHGAGQLGSAIATGDPNTQGLAAALSAAGYVVVSSNYRTQNCWGNQACVEDIRNLYDAFTQKLHLEARPFVIGTSMGGIVSWNAIIHGDFVPQAVVGIFPACNLPDMYNNPSFARDIQKDYGFTNRSNFAIATKGFDPVGSENLEPLTKFPILMWSSYGDQAVKKTANADLLASKVNALGGSASVITTTGDHGDISNFQPDALVNFFNAAHHAD